jgi:hypothetical protein
VHHCSGNVGVPLDSLKPALEPVAVAVGGDDFAVVQEAVEDRGGEDFIAEDRDCRNVRLCPVIGGNEG